MTEVEILKKMLVNQDAILKKQKEIVSLIKNVEDEVRRLRNDKPSV